MVNQESVFSFSELEMGLGSGKFNEREAAVRKLGELGGSESIQAIGGVLSGDSNNNLRKLAADTLGKMGAGEAVRPLADCLKSDSEEFVRKAAAAALGALRDDSAIEPLVQALRGDPHLSVAFACAGALSDGFESSKVMPYYVDAVRTRGEPKLRGFLVKLIGRKGKKEDGRLLVPYLSKKEPQEVRRAAIVACIKLGGIDALRDVEPLLKDDPDVAIRKKVAASLGEVQSTEMVRPLCEALLLDTDLTVREAARESLEKFSDCAVKIGEVLRLAKEHGLRRSDIKAPVVFQSFRSGPKGEDGGALEQDIVDRLISESMGAGRDMTGLIAALIVAGCGDDLARAARYIDEYEREKGLGGTDLRPLRIEIGGEMALDPILGILERDLKKYFQKPIHELNEETKISWRKTVQAARWGFLARMVMSCVVFIVGMALVIVSAWKFLTGQMEGAELWGAGLSFGTGLGTMLLVIYTGPLKDIRQAVSDLGASNAAFIAYVHRVLQTSHTFSSYYLDRKISFEEMGKAGSLIRGAMRDTIQYLQYNLSGSVSEPGIEDAVTDGDSRR